MTSSRENGPGARDTDKLEQRVLSHERSFRAFIAALSVRVPTLVEGLRKSLFGPSQNHGARQERNATDVQSNEGLGLSSTASGGVRLRLRNGIWQGSVDGAFRGHYHQKDHAIAALADVRQGLR